MRASYEPSELVPEPPHKKTICICENKDADQLRSNCEADQRLCFRYIGIVQVFFFSIPKFHGSSLLLWLYRQVCVRPGRKLKLLVFSCQSSPTNYPTFCVLIVLKNAIILERIYIRPKKKKEKKKKKKKKKNVSGNPTDPVKNSPTLIFFSCFPKIKTRKSKKERVFQVPDRQMNKKIN